MPPDTCHIQPVVSPFMAVLWKEWRESWWLLIATVAVAPGASLVCGHTRVSFLLVALMSLLLGARLFASESATESKRP